MKLFKLIFALMRILFVILSVLAPRLAARWAYKMFFTPMGLPRPDSEMPYYESANRSSMAYNGKKVALYTWGDGAETILLLHGWASRGTRMGHLAEALVEKATRSSRLTCRLMVIRREKPRTFLKSRSLQPKFVKSRVQFTR